MSCKRPGSVSLVQGSCGQLHQDIRGDSTAVPSSDEMRRSTFILHPAGNLGLVRFPHEPDGGSLPYQTGPVTATHRFDVSALTLVRSLRFLWWFFLFWSLFSFLKSSTPVIRRWGGYELIISWSNMNAVLWLIMLFRLKEMEQSMNMLNSNQELPDVSELVTKFFSPPKSQGRPGGGARVPRGGAPSVRGGAPRRRGKTNMAVSYTE